MDWTDNFTLADGAPLDPKTWINGQPGNAGVIAGGMLKLALTPGVGQWQGTTVRSVVSQQYGLVSARLKTSTVPGVATCFGLRDEASKDEILFEWVGKNPGSVQTNYYWRGVLDYTKGVQVELESPVSDNHTYTIEWTPDQINWSCDDKIVRTVRRETPQFPDSPAQIWIAIWDGGSGSPGTRDWAGGPIPKGTPTQYAFVDRVSCKSLS